MMFEPMQRESSQQVNAEGEASGPIGGDRRGQSDNGWHREKGKSHEQGSRWGRLLRKNWFELLWLLAVVLGIVLVVEQINIRMTLVGWLRNLAQGSARGLGHLETALATFLAGLSLSDRVGIGMVLTVSVAGLVRLRYRLMHNAALATIACPKCSGHLHRVHRTRLDRMLSVFVPLLRYQCADRKCRWQGLRVSGSAGKGHGQHTRKRS